MLEQYGSDGADYCPRHLGKSMIDQTPVVEDLKARWPVTVRIGHICTDIRAVNLNTNRYLFSHQAGFNR